MTAYLYTWDLAAQKWAVKDILDCEEAARIEGRRLWREGVAGIKIDVTKTVVEQKRR